MDNKTEETPDQLDQAGSDLLLSVGRIMTAQDRHDDGLTSDDSGAD